MRLRKALALALAIAAAGVIAGCGEKSEDVQPGNPEPFDVALDFYVNPDHVGIYEAIDRGFFRDAGLDVRPSAPSDPSAPIKQVAAGSVDLAISYEPEVLLAHDQGLPVKAVAAVVPTPLTSLIWLEDSGIRAVKDLRGKTIATAGIPYQAAYLDTILERSGLSSDDVGGGGRPTGAAARDSLWARRRDAGRVSERRGGGSEPPREEPDGDPGGQAWHPDVQRAGAGRQLRSPRRRLARHPPVHRRARAGHEGRRRRPESRDRDLLEAGKGLDPKITAAQVRRTIPLLLPAKGTAYGYMDPREWQRFAQFFADDGLIEALPSTGDVLTNDLLPGRIPD